MKRLNSPGSLIFWGDRCDVIDPLGSHQWNLIFWAYGFVKERNTETLYDWVITSNVFFIYPKKERKKLKQSELFFLFVYEMWMWNFLAVCPPLWCFPLCGAGSTARLFLLLYNGEDLSNSDTCISIGTCSSWQINCSCLCHCRLERIEMFVSCNSWRFLTYNCLLNLI